MLKFIESLRKKPNTDTLEEVRAREQAQAELSRSYLMGEIEVEEFMAQMSQFPGINLHLLARNWKPPID